MPDSLKRYTIIRFFDNGYTETIRTGLRPDQVKAHMDNPNSSSSGRTGFLMRDLFSKKGGWTDKFILDE